MPYRFRLLSVLLATLVCAASAHAEALLKPLDVPNVSKLPPDKAADVNKGYQEFQKMKPGLVGQPLIEAYTLLAALYVQNGLYDEAGVALEDAALLAPKDGRWVYLQGILAKLQKQDAVAQNYFDLAFSLDKEYLPIRLAVVTGRIANGRLDEARDVLADYTVKHPDEAAPLAMLGDIALRQKHYAVAIDRLQRALKAQPQANKLYAQLAQAYDGMGDTKAASDARAKAGDVTPSLADPLAQGFVGRAPAATAKADPIQKLVSETLLFLEARQYDAARAHLDTALKSRPGDSTLLALYARVEAAAGNLAKASERANAAVKADPRNALAYLSQGRVLEMQADDDGARRAYQRATELDGKLADARLSLGRLLLRTGAVADAIPQLRALVQADPANPEAWTSLIAADVVAGRCINALKDVRDVLALDQKNAFLTQMFVRLASTCPAASAEERKGALEFAVKLYREGAAAPVGEALALALAANGRWDDAVETQRGAMFMLVRNGQKHAVPAYQEVLQQLQAHKLPDRPWVASAAVYKPTRPAPDPAPSSGK